MKKILILVSFVFLSTLCYSQAFDKEMIQAGEDFNKHSKKIGKTKRVSNKSRKSSKAMSNSGNVSKKAKKPSKEINDTGTKKNRVKKKSSSPRNKFSS